MYVLWTFKNFPDKQLVNVLLHGFKKVLFGTNGNILRQWNFIILFKWIHKKCIWEFFLFLGLQIAEKCISSTGDRRRLDIQLYKDIKSPNSVLIYI